MSVSETGPPSPPHGGGESLAAGPPAAGPRIDPTLGGLPRRGSSPWRRLGSVRLALRRPLPPAGRPPARRVWVELGVGSRRPRRPGRSTTPRGPARGTPAERERQFPDLPDRTPRCSKRKLESMLTALWSGRGHSECHHVSSISLDSSPPGVGAAAVRLSVRPAGRRPAAVCAPLPPAPRAGGYCCGWAVAGLGHPPVWLLCCAVLCCAVGSRVACDWPWHRAPTAGGGLAGI